MEFDNSLNICQKISCEAVFDPALMCCDVILHLIALMESHYFLSGSLAEVQGRDWRRGTSRSGHVQSLLSGYKRINILINPECLPGQLNLTLSIHCCVSLLSLCVSGSLPLSISNSPLISKQEREMNWLAFDVLIGRRRRRCGEGQLYVRLSLGT